MAIKEKGFTIIELLVVIAIISLLAGIVLTNVSNLSTRAKIARVNTDLVNLRKALLIFSAQYGDYPWGWTGDQTYTYFFSGYMGGSGDPYLEVGGEYHYLSEVYRQDWDGFNASFFAPNAFYLVDLWDSEGDGRIGCGDASIYDENWNWYGYKNVLCDDCPGNCLYEYTFRTTPY